MLLNIKKKVQLGLLSMVISSSVFALSPECDYVKNIENFSSVTSENAECVVALVAEETNKGLPAQIDAYTSLMSIMANGNVLSYKYHINNLPEGINLETVSTTMSMMLLNSNCTTPEVKVLLDAGITLSHNYFGNTGKFLFKRDVSSEDCKSIK